MKKMKNIKGFIVKSTLFIMTLLVFYNVSSQNSNPNIVIIYVDDLRRCTFNYRSKYGNLAQNASKSRL